MHAALAWTSDVLPDRHRSLLPTPSFGVTGHVLGVFLFLVAAPWLKADETGFEYDRTESYLSLSVWSPPADSSSPYVESCPVKASVYRQSWEIWTNPETGATEVRNEQYLPADGAMLSFSVDGGEGSIGSGPWTTNSNGEVSTTFQFGITGATIWASAELNGVSVSGSLYLESPFATEQWTYDHSEGTLEPRLSSLESTESVAPGGQCNLTLEVLYVSWDIYVSNLGRRAVQNYAVSPAQGGGVSWNYSGSGYVAGDPTLDASGRAFATATIGHGGTCITAQVSYSSGVGSQSTEAFLDVTAAAEPPAPDPSTTPDPSITPDPTSGPDPATTWRYDHSEEQFSFNNVSIAGSPWEIPSGQSQTVSGYLQRNVWDVWVNCCGQTSYNYSFSGGSGLPQVNVSVLGNATVSSSSVIPDPYSGYFTFTFSATGPGQIQVECPGVSCTPATIDFTVQAQSTDPTPDPSPEPPVDPATDPANQWTCIRSESFDWFSDLLVNGPTYDLPPGENRLVSGDLKWYSWSVYRNGNGLEETRDYIEMSLAHTALDVVIENLDDPNVAPEISSVTTDGSGHFDVPFTMGTHAARLRIVVPNSYPEESTSVTFTPPPPPEPEVFTFDHKEGTFDVQILPTAEEIREGQPTPVLVQVIEDSWEIWLGDRGTQERRNDYQGPAIGVPVTIWVQTGSGLIPDSGGTTDATGGWVPYCSLNQGNLILCASVSYGGVNGSGEYQGIVAPPHTGGGFTWTLSQTSRALEFTFPASQWGILHGIARWRTVETWIRDGDSTYSDLRTSITPASGAALNFGFVWGAGTVGESGSTGDDGSFYVPYQVTERSGIRVAGTFNEEYAETEVEVTAPPVTTPPVTTPPVTTPPVTTPPVTTPQVTQPQVTQPPVTQPPVTQPPPILLEAETEIKVRQRLIETVGGEHPLLDYFTPYEMHYDWQGAPTNLEIQTEDEVWTAWNDCTWAWWWGNDVKELRWYEEPLAGRMTFPNDRTRYSTSTNSLQASGYSYPSGPYPQLRWSEVWLERVAKSAGTPCATDTNFRRTYLIHVGVGYIATEDHFGTVTFDLKANTTLSAPPVITGDQKVLESVKVAPNGALRIAPPQQGHNGTWISVDLFPVDIEPDSNMAGVIGDVVKSAKPGSTIEHFVTPKKSPELNQEHVILKAVGVTSDQITAGNANQIVKWDGGEAVPGEPLKRRVKRDTTGNGPTEVKIIAKQGGVVAAQMNVWVVWAENTLAENTGDSTAGMTNFNPQHLEQAYYLPKEPRMRFEFGIKPAKIITDYETGDVPDLKGPNESRPLDGPDGVWGNGVREKWDVTRKIHIVHSNPSPTTILATDLQPAPLSRVQVTAQAETFPSRSLVIVKRPAGDDANDDSGASDEANNPYLDTDRGVITDNSLNEIAFVKPGIGKIGSVDAPMLTFVRLLAGQADEELSWSASFEEYVRLEIAGKWYRISNFKPWTYSAKFKKINGTMEDNGSVSDPNP